MWPCSTCACPTATVSRSAARSGPAIPRSSASCSRRSPTTRRSSTPIMAGAAGYVLKQVRGNDLVDSVQRVARGQSLLDPSMTAAVLERLRRGPDDETGGVHLTERERQHPRPAGRGPHQPPDRRAAVPRREDRQELRVEPAHEAGHAPAHRGRGVRRSPGRPARPPPPLRSAAITRTPRHRSRRRRSAGDRRARPPRRRRGAVTRAGGSPWVGRDRRPSGRRLWSAGG